MLTGCKSKEEETKLKTHQIFNIAEKPIMEFISQFLDEPHDTIFRDDLPNTSEPLILLPLAEYKNDVYIKFTVNPIKLSDDNRSKVLINNIIENQVVKNGIGFLWYCIKEVFTSVVLSSLINKNPLDNIIIELDEQNWTFYPKYLCELSHKKNLLENTINKLTNLKETNPNSDNINDINKTLYNAITELNKVNEEITPEMLADECRINESYSNNVVLGIFTEEINKEDLPKPITRPDKISKESDTHTDEKNNTYDLEDRVSKLFT